MANFKKGVETMRQGSSKTALYERISRMPHILRRLGLKYVFHCAYVRCILPTAIMASLPLLKAYLWIMLPMNKYVLVNSKLAYWRKNKKEILLSGSGGYRARIEDLGLSAEGLNSIMEACQSPGEVVIGEVDQDGFVFSRFGPIKNIATIPKEQWMVRKRFSLALVVKDGYVGIKKDYKGNKQFFLNEITALYHLNRNGCRVPSVLDVDFDKLIITTSFIVGDALRTRLSREGAALLDRDVNGRADFGELTEEQIEYRCIQEGRRVLDKTIEPCVAESIFTVLKKMHALRFIWNDVKYGNIIIEQKSGEPYLIDFNSTRYCPKLVKGCFDILRDEEIEKFNNHFGAKKLTRKRLSEILDRVKENDIYAPVYFGPGLSMGNVLGDASGYGRWQYMLKDSLPSVSGKRILDLGSNNASIAMQLLRHGAREVVGIELCDKYIEQGSFVKEGFEYIDSRYYAFRYVVADMKEIESMDLGGFDMVLALCSLYYLDDSSIERTVKYLSALTDIFVLQCNIDPDSDRPDSHSYEKASIRYAEKALKGNGFPFTRTVSPYGYSRPLVIGAKREELLFGRKGRVA